MRRLQKRWFKVSNVGGDGMLTSHRSRDPTCPCNRKQGESNGPFRWVCRFHEQKLKELLPHSYFFREVEGQFSRFEAWGEVWIKWGYERRNHYKQGGEHFLGWRPFKRGEQEFRRTSTGLCETVSSKAGRRWAVRFPAVRVRPRDVSPSA